MPRRRKWPLSDAEIARRLDAVEPDWRGLRGDDLDRAAVAAGLAGSYIASNMRSSPMITHPDGRMTGGVGLHYGGAAGGPDTAMAERQLDEQLDRAWTDAWAEKERREAGEAEVAAAAAEYQGGEDARIAAQHADVFEAVARHQARTGAEHDAAQDTPVDEPDELPVDPARRKLPWRRGDGDGR